MNKIPMCCIAVAVLLTMTAPAEEKAFTISGEIRFKGTGTILLALITESQFKEEGIGIKRFRKKLTPGEAATGVCTFFFTDVPEGVYGIRGFLDVDGDQKLPMGLTGPKEPWGMSWRDKRPLLFPKFKQMCFTLDRDTSIQLNFK